MSGWEKYFEKIVCEKNTGIDKDLYPFMYYFDYESCYVKSPIIYVYRNKKATELENNLPMPPTDSFENMFYDCNSISNIDGLKNWDTSNVKNMSYMFDNCASLLNVDGLKNWNTSNVIDMSYMFYDCDSLLNVDGLKNWNTKNVIDMTHMFDGCESLLNIDNLKYWDTRNVVDMRYMFDGCYSLTSYPDNLRELRELPNKQKNI